MTRPQSTSAPARRLPFAETIALLLPLALVLAAAGFGAGCGGGSGHSTGPIVKAPSLPVGTPSNTAPDSTLMRWVAAYAAKVTSEYDTLLTSDFRYRFSAQTDPALDSEYGANWRKSDEEISFRHLVSGFTNSQGTYLPPAQSMTEALMSVSVGADPSHADSAAWYQQVSAQLDMTVDVPSAEGGITYNIVAFLQLHLVRGDAAVLSPGQDASATRWYVRECDDVTPLYAARKAGPVVDIPLPASTTTWGRLRAQYRS